MMVVIWLGALLVVAGVVLLANQAIWRGQLSGQETSSSAPAETLEPRRRGMRFLGLGSNWPGILMLVLGAALLLFGGFA
jgi:drug/metabolite transporter (DMT)-like permease